MSRKKRTRRRTAPDISPEAMLLFDLHSALKAARTQRTYLPLQRIAALFRATFDEAEREALAVYLTENAYDEGTIASAGNSPALA